MADEIKPPRKFKTPPDRPVHQEHAYEVGSIRRIRCGGGYRIKRKPLSK